jgi:hypothetical protein
MNRNVRIAKFLFRSYTMKFICLSGIKVWKYLPSILWIKRMNGKSFLNQHELHDWINVWDEHHVSRFKILYDARTTPGIFILDEQ